jgi:drug/metabolite transporter (DMT)-like permease
VCWGLADYGATILGRRGGSFPVLLAAHFGAVVGMTLLLPIAPGGGLSSGELLACAALGPLAVATFASLFRALELGPLAIVSPVVSAWAVVTLALALLLLGESLGTAEAAGCALLVGGVLLGTGGGPADADGIRRDRSGVAFALGATLGLGIHNFVLAHLAEDAGWFLPLYVTRVAGVALMVAIVARSRQWPWRRLKRRDLLLAMTGPGLMAALGSMAFNRGAEVGSVSITTAASSIYPLLAVAAGVVLLHEHLRRRQTVGLLAIFAGLLVLGVAA